MTLLELLAVVTIIGVFVALAMPGMAGVMGDRHAARASEDVSGMFRIARARAIATGAAHLIRVENVAADGSPAGDTSRFTLRATSLTTVGPTGSCLSPQWTDADSIVIQTLDFGANTGSYSGRNIRVYPEPDSGLPAKADFCFTPGGSSWWKTTGVWLHPRGTQTARWEFSRFDPNGRRLGIRRVLRLAPNGLPAVEAS